MMITEGTTGRNTCENGMKNNIYIPMSTTKDVLKPILNAFSTPGNKNKDSSILPIKNIQPTVNITTSEWPHISSQELLAA